MDLMLKIVGAAVLVVSLVVAMGLLVSYPVMLLWNGCIVGTIAGVGKITWLQAWGIVVLCGLLFKSNVSSSK